MRKRLVLVMERRDRQPCVILLIVVALWGAFSCCGRAGPPEEDAVPEVNYYGILGWLEGSPESVALSPDGQTVALSYTKYPLRLFDVASGKELFRLQKPNERIGGVAFAPDGQTLATTGHLLGNKTPIRIWDVATRQVLHELPFYSAGCRRLAYSPDSKLLATLEDYSDIRLWNVNTGQLIVALRQKIGNQVCRLAFSPDGKTLAVGTWWDGIVELWDLSGPLPLPELHKAKPRLTIETGSERLVHVGYTPKGESLVTACEKNLVQFWDPKTGKLQKTLSVPIVLDKQSLDILTKGGTRKVELPPFKFNRIESLAISPDGKTMAVGIGRIYLIDLVSNTMRSKSIKCSSVHEIAFAPDGSFLVTASGPGGFIFKLPKMQ